jgi:hypothetical protein
MSDKRQLELYLLRFFPHVLRDDFVTVGLVLVEGDGGFAEVQFTREWRMLECIAPDVELEWFQTVEDEIHGKLGRLKRREELVQFVNERFGTVIDVAPTKAVMTEDPAKEMQVLTSMYLLPTDRGERARQRTGTVGHCRHDEVGVHRCGSHRSAAARFGHDEVHRRRRFVSR